MILYLVMKHLQLKRIALPVEVAQKHKATHMPWMMSEMKTSDAKLENLE